MLVEITNIIRISNPTNEIKQYCKQQLTINNPDYNKKKMMGFWTGLTPKVIKLYEVYDDYYYLPIGCIDDIYNIAPPPIAEYKDFSVIKNVEVESDIKLRSYQEPCPQAVIDKFTGLLILPAGCGKTLSALECFATIKQKCIWLTHTQDLLTQAKQECENNIKCKTSTITKGKCDYSGDIVFATVQTLVNIIDKSEIPQDEFGLVIVDECFPAGTKINTPNGYVNIEDIKIGDIVYSYNHSCGIIEEKEVDETFKKNITNLITITLSNGKKIECTENHPFYTNNGYVKAIDLKRSDIVYEMQPMWKRINERELHSKQMVEKNLIFKKTWCNILFQRMWSSSYKQCPCRLYKIRKRKKSYAYEQSNGTRRNQNTCIQNFEGKRLQTTDTWWKWYRYDCSARDVEKSSSRQEINCNGRICCEDQNESRFWLSNMLQNRFRNTGIYGWYRSRWGEPQIFKKKRTGFEKKYVLRELRVENIEIQEQRSFKEHKQCGRNNYVYNIGVNDNNNYFVNDVLVHNCHHLAVSAETVMQFQKCLNFFAARYKIGLSATPHRADGLEITIPKLIGPIIYELKKEGDVMNGYYNNKIVVSVPTKQFQVPAKIHFVLTQYSVVNKNVFDKRNQTVDFSKLLTSIATDSERNKLVISLLESLKGSTIIVSDRTEQLKTLAEYFGEDAFYVDGKTKKKIREEGLNKVREGKVKYLFASYKLICEGFNAPILTNLVMATPVKDLRIVIQSVGRVQRPYKGKTFAHVYDIVDDVGKLDKFLRERKKIYKKEGYVIE